MSSWSASDFHPFCSVDGRDICNWRTNWKLNERRPICRDYSSGGNCVGFSGSPTRDVRTMRSGELAYIPPVFYGASTIYIKNCTDEPLEFEFRNRIHRITPPIQPNCTTKVMIQEFAPPELGLVKTARILPGWKGRRPHQYRTAWTTLNAGTTYNITMYEDRLLVDDTLKRRS